VQCGEVMETTGEEGDDLRELKQFQAILRCRG